MVGHHPITLLRRDFVGLHVKDGTPCSASFTPLTFIFPPNEGRGLGDLGHGSALIHLAIFPFVSKEGSNKQ
jgi:hypothetical protein